MKGSADMATVGYELTPAQKYMQVCGRRAQLVATVNRPLTAAQFRERMTQHSQSEDFRLALQSVNHLEHPLQTLVVAESYEPVVFDECPMHGTHLKTLAQAQAEAVDLGSAQLRCLLLIRHEGLEAIVLSGSGVFHDRQSLVQLLDQIFTEPLPLEAPAFLDIAGYLCDQSPPFSVTPRDESKASLFYLPPSPDQLVLPEAFTFSLDIETMAKVRCLAEHRSVSTIALLQHLLTEVIEALQPGANVSAYAMNHGRFDPEVEDCHGRLAYPYRLTNDTERDDRAQQLALEQLPQGQLPLLFYTHETPLNPDYTLDYVGDLPLLAVLEIHLFVGQPERLCLFYAETLISQHHLVTIENACRYRIDADYQQQSEQQALANPLGNKILSDRIITTTAPSEALANRAFQVLAKALGTRPDAIATVHYSQPLSYLKVLRRAYTYSQAMASGGAVKGGIIAVEICAEIDYLSAIIACWRLQSAFMFFQKNTPPGVTSVLSAVCAADLNTDEAPGVKSLIDWLAAEVPAEVPAYCISTSGTQGSPKRVVVSQQNLASYVHSLEAALSSAGLSQCHRFACLNSPAMDLCYTNIVLALISAGELHSFSYEQSLDSDYLHGYFANHDIDFLKTTPSHLSSLYQLNSVLPKRLLMLGGEELTTHFAGQLLATADAQLRLFNHYGPAETTIGVCVCAVDKETLANNTVPIGRPLGDNQLFVVDHHGRELPRGMAGELVIVGPNVARYLSKDATQTSGFFYTQDSDGNTISAYRSGDVCFRLPNGDLVYQARLDCQLKRRGYRIHPRTLELAVDQVMPGLECAVEPIRSEQGEEHQLQALVLFVKPQHEGLDTGQLLCALRASVDDALLPDHIWAVGAWPLTVNGKLDRSRLRDIHHKNLSRQSTADHSDFREHEQALADIWQTILGHKQFDRDTSFFNAGGDSLLVTQLVSKIRHQFRADFQIPNVFNEPRFGPMAEEIERIVASEQKATAVPTLCPRQPGEGINVSEAQRRLWFLCKLDQDKPVYNVPLVSQIQGPLCRDALEAAFRELLDRHTVLCSHFEEVAGEPVPVMDQTMQWSLDYCDLLAVSEDQRQSALDVLVSEALQTPIALNRSPLFLVQLVKTAADAHVFIFVIHHILSDGWSTTLFLRELFAIYEAMLQQRPAKLAPISLDYYDYAAWQQNFLQSDQYQRQLDFWLQQCQQLPEPLNFPQDFSRPLQQTFRGGRQSFAVPRALASKVKAYAKQRDITLYMLLLSTFAVCLSRWCRQQQLCIGTVIANRNQQEVEPLIGLFVNTLPLMIHVEDDQAFTDVLAHVRDVCVQTYQHQDVPFEKLVEKLSPERDMSRSVLFQAMFALEASNIREVASGDLTLKPYDCWNGTAKFDIDMDMWSDDEGMTGIVEFNADVIASQTIKRFIGSFIATMAAVMDSPDSPLVVCRPNVAINDLSVLQAQGETPYNPNNTCLLEMIVSHAKAVPQQTAIGFDTETISYGELLEQVESYAAVIHQRSQPDGRVLMYQPKQIALIVAILACWRCGRSVALINPELTHTQLQSVSTILNPTLCILDDEIVLEGINCPRYSLSQLDSLAQEDNSQAPAASEPLSELYVVLTSGSSGVPKAVSVPERAMIQVLPSWQTLFDLNEPAQVHLQLAAVGFDVFIADVVRSLCLGGRLVLVDKHSLLDAQILYKLIATQAINCAEFVPASLRLLMDYCEKQSLPIPNINNLIVGSDKWTVAEYRRLQTLVQPGTRVFNTYGLAEACVDSLYFTGSTEALSEAMAVPIGLPMTHTDVLIIDIHWRVVERGIPGEICLASEALFNGYVLEDGFDTQKLITVEVDGQPRRALRTGDLGCIDIHNNVTLLGRIDRQVKVRGWRINVEEIESTICRLEPVEEALVLPSPDGLSTIGFIKPNPSANRSNTLGSDKVVSSWQRVFDAEDFYDARAQASDEFQGWNSSITGEPIPRDDMFDWQQATHQQILRLSPRRVLEIGCGNGLVLEGIANYCQCYYGSDLSASVIRHLQQRVEAWQLPTEVRLFHAPASDLSYLNGQRFDCVIINSVIQYFPSLTYFMRVLENLLAVVDVGGQLFLGDIRNLQLLEDFHFSLALAHADPKEALSTIRSQAWYRQDAEEELFLDPQLFLELKIYFDRIVDVRLHPKLMHCANELSSYRYDVVITLDHAQTYQSCFREWKNDQSLVAHIARWDGRGELVITGIPNQLQDAYWARRQQYPDTDTSVEAFTRTVESTERVSIMPVDLFTRLRDQGYQCSVSMTATLDPAFFDLHIHRSSNDL